MDYVPKTVDITGVVVNDDNVSFSYGLQITNKSGEVVADSNSFGFAPVAYFKVDRENDVTTTLSDLLIGANITVSIFPAITKWNALVKNTPPTVVIDKNVPSVRVHSGNIPVYVMVGVV